MTAKLKPALLPLFGLCFAGLAVALFLPDANLVPTYSLFLPIVLAIQLVGDAPIGFILAGFATLLGVFCLTRVAEPSVITISMTILALWGMAFILYTHRQRLSQRVRNSQRERDDMAKESHVLRQEIGFYEQRKNDLAVNAAKRRQLSMAARELGAALDPQLIQERLLEAAARLFPGRPLRLSNGHDFDAIDALVVQKKQPLQLPNEMYKVDPLIAAPVFMQRAVAAVLRVGGISGPAFSKEDLRLLDILAGLASMALDNTALFNQVQETALRDGLTGLLTHRAFQDQLQTAVLEASRYGQPLSVILADVDHFKSVNDTYGHQAGDQILQGFAHVLDRNVRPGVDIVSRYGGEEFIVLLLQTPHASAVETAERIRQDLAALEFDVGAKPLSITSSFGVATFPDDATSAQQLIRQADQRLYRAKEAGRNRVKGR